MPPADIVHHLKYLDYYRLMLSTKKDINKLNGELEKLSQDEKMTIMMRIRELRRNLKKEYRRCRDGIRRVENKLGR